MCQALFRGSESKEEGYQSKGPCFYEGSILRGLYRQGRRKSIHRLVSRKADEQRFRSGVESQELHFTSPRRPHWHSSKGCQGKARQEKLRGGGAGKASHPSRTACAEVGKGLASSGNRMKVKTAVI